MDGLTGNVYVRLFKKCVGQTILRAPHTLAVAVASFVLTLLAAYVIVKTSDSIVEISDTFQTEAFGPVLMRFFYLSSLALVLKYLPKVVYTIVLQEICRRQFVNFLGEYLRLNYVRFHEKTPGEMRYSIFLKSFASVMCSHLVIFEMSAMLGMAVFSFLKISGDVSFVSATIFILVPLAYLVTIVYFIKIKLKYQTAYLQQQEKVSTELYDKLINYDLIKTYNLEQSETDTFYEHLNGQMVTHIEMGMVDAKGSLFFSFFLIVPYILIVLIALLQHSATGHSDLFKTTLLYISLSSQLKRLGNELCSLMMYLNQIKYSDIEDFSADEGGPEKEDVAGFADSIEFRNVTLYYGTKKVVRDINTTIRKGEKIAVVGANGTGKSTFVKSLLGFTRFSGDLFFDGKNTSRLNWKSILKQVSYIPQEDYTSDDTIINNLRLGDKDATDEFIENRARLFGAHETFAKMENGYETESGPRGNKLSGGQLQKLSLVRAAVKDAPIFILDEATASMDKSYENMLIQRLFENLKEKTMIMIVHGKEHLKLFDRIFFLDNGTLEQTGTYDELVSANPRFKAFVQ